LVDRDVHPRIALDFISMRKRRKVLHKRNAWIAQQGNPMLIPSSPTSSDSEAEQNTASFECLSSCPGLV